MLIFDMQFLGQSLGFYVIRAGNVGRRPIYLSHPHLIIDTGWARK
jgi:hypothetical protein